MRLDEVSVIFILTIGLARAKNTTADDGSLEELELELVQEPEKRGRSRGVGSWSAWSVWSPCSRTCDGGVSSQLRACQSPSGCHGQSIRYKICNMQPCPEAVDFREEQCQAYNSIPYHDTYLKWAAHHDPHEPCALTCRGRPLREWPDNSDTDAENSADAPDDALIVVQLALKVQDATRCRTGSLDMCIDGECQRVGCDLRIGSTRRVDECGICGGDGSSCAQPLYHWTQAAASLCSATCGGGYKMSRPLCKNRLTDVEVEEFLCNMAQRPQPKIVECNNHPCPAQWVANEWGPCSLTCGGGVRLRDVYCSGHLNSTTFKVAAHRCSGPRPPHEELCPYVECPSWKTTPWSQCSASCGGGIQTRAVTCGPGESTPMSKLHCSESDRPAAMQPCPHQDPCPLTNHPYSLLGGTSSWESLSEPEGDFRQPLLFPYPPSHLMSAPLPATAERLVAPEMDPPTPSEATFIAEDWGPCNVTCGEGVRRREVHCKIFLEFSRAIARLPDQECNGPKPVQVERCVRDPCAMDNRMDLAADRAFSDQTAYGAVQPQASEQARNRTYSWKDNGWTDCSATCLGGVHELIIACFRDRDGKTVSPGLCNPLTRPENLVRTCNDFPCPPRWNYSEFQPCSKPCGMGIQLREVNCVHEVTRGPENTITVPNSMCPSPEPSDRQYCNVLDCPVRWHTGNWSKCSKPCGQGIKSRNVTCQQIMAQDRVMSRPVSMCSSIKPPDKKPCNSKPCIETDRPTISSDPDQTFVQSNPQRKKVTLKVGGTALVYLGTQVKIRCPVKRYDRSKIRWEKDHVPVDKKSARMHVSNKGALKINKMGYPDKGVYACLAGRSTAELILSARPLPGIFPTSEEIHQAQNQVDNTAYHEANPDLGDMGQYIKQPFMNPGDDLSHELKTDVVAPPTKKPREDLRRHQPKATQPAATMTTTHKQDEDEERSLRHSEVASEVPSSPSSTSSSGASTLRPHFQQLLLSLQMFGVSRGHRALPLQAPPAPAPAPFPLLADSGEDVDDDDLAGPPLVLGKGSADNLVFEWVVTQWTQCSEPCGGNGFQMRSAHCMLRLQNTTQYVGDGFCEDAGLATPSTVQKCGHDCPHWSHSAWSPCEDSRCFTWNTAMQRRDVSCLLSNGTEVDAALCPTPQRPPQRQECYNDKCKGTWKVGDWSECAAECEQEGIKYRILQCVWYGTKKPAGNACRDQSRPSVMKVCKGPPCAQSSECKDHSKFCHSVLTKNMCRVYRYQTQCCHTCRGRLLGLSHGGGAAAGG